MRADGFALAIRVGGDVNSVGLFAELLHFIENFRLAGKNRVGRLEILLQIDAQFFFGQILHVAERRADGVVASEIFVDRFRLGGRFDDDQRTSHNSEYFLFVRAQRVYSITFKNCLPGNCRTRPFISSSNKAESTSDEFIFDCSTSSSTCFDRSTSSIAYSAFSEGARPSVASDALPAPSVVSTGKSSARIGVGSSSTTSSHPVTSFAPCLISWFGPTLAGCVA